MSIPNEMPLWSGCPVVADNSHSDLRASGDRLRAPQASRVRGAIALPGSLPSVQRRFGWAVLAGLGAALFALTAIGVSWQVGASIGDGDLGAAASAVGVGALTLLFWWWITLGAWRRFRPPLDPATGLPVHAGAQSAAREG